MNDHSFAGLLHRLTPTSSALWVVAACVLGLLAGLYVWSLAWVYSTSRRRLARRQVAIAATVLAALSWPGSLLLMRAIHPPTAPRRARKPLGRWTWILAALAAGTATAFAIVAPNRALGLGLLLVLLGSAALGAAISASLAIVVAIGQYMDTIPGVVSWGVIALGMLAFVVWNERRVMRAVFRRR